MAIAIICVAIVSSCLYFYSSLIRSMKESDGNKFLKYHTSRDKEPAQWIGPKFEDSLQRCLHLRSIAKFEDTCLSSRSSTAMNILKAQELVLNMDEVCMESSSSSTNRTSEDRGKCLISLNENAINQAAFTPDWVEYGRTNFGIWLFPRLKLVLFGCPKCGNSQVRRMLNMMSVYAQEEEMVDSMVKIPAGRWRRESDHSWQILGMIERKKSARFLDPIKWINNEDAFEYIQQAIANPEWWSMEVIRHPYGRLSSAFAELELRWNREEDKQRLKSLNMLNNTFFQKEKNTVERALAFWVGMVLGEFYFPPNATFWCLTPIMEIYHLFPISSFFLRDSADCEDSSLYEADIILNIDNVETQWPQLIEKRYGHWNSSVRENLKSMAKVHENTKAGSNETINMKHLLKSNDAFRESVNKFYSHDFFRFDFEKDPEVINILK